MGHSHGRKWTEEDMIEELKKVMESLNIERMPSRKEIEDVTGNASLTGRISKTGGFYYWADKLGLEKKNSCTLEAIKYETIFVDEMNRLGYDCQLTPLKFPYDAIVNGATKVDVKISNGYTNERTGFFFTFNLEYTIPKCDFYVFYCVHELCTKTLIVPAHVMTGKKQFSIGLKSKYDIYIDQWNLINDHVDFMENLKGYVY